MMKPMTRRAALAALIALAGCDRGTPGAVPEREAPIDVAVSSPAATASTRSVPADVVATRRARLATRTSGTIERVLVDVGARVVRGETLATLDTTEINARVRGAEAAARVARKYHDRIQALARDGAATAQELDEARARLEMAEASLRDARAQRAYVVLRAPFAGAITARMADPGDLASPGTPILELLGTDDLEIEADLAAGLAEGLAVGDRVGVLHAETGRRFPARITRIAPALERSSRRFRVEARFDDAAPALRPGAYVRLELGGPGRPTRWIPADAVFTRGQLTGVFVVVEDRLRLRWIRIGRTQDGAVEVLAGPEPGARIVRNPPPGLADMAEVGRITRIDWTPPVPEEPAAEGETR